MNIQPSNPVTNGIKVAGAIILASLSTVGNAVGKTTFMPFPIGNLYLSLAQNIPPVTLSMNSIPIQSAKANSDFNLNLKTYVAVSRTDVRYTVTNGFMEHHTTNTVSKTLIVNGLPSGVIQVNNQSGDCPISFQLLPNQSCTLHLYVDRDKYVSAANGYGPYVLANLEWAWGHHFRNFGETNVSATAAASTRLVDLLTPVILPVTLTVQPNEQDGLTYNPKTQSIKGTPTRTGIYKFQVSAAHGTLKTAPRELQIQVSINAKDKPIFKPNYNIANGMPGQEYRLNLMDLIEPKKGFGVTNQVSFRIDTNHEHPRWLAINPGSTSILQGRVPRDEAGAIKAITLIATSNTGGDSEPFTMKLPIAYDPSKKPIIRKSIELKASAGEAIHNDFRADITDPTADGNIKISINSIKPQAPWLAVSAANPTELIGTVPNNAVGQNYAIALQASNTTGGASDPETIPLQIAINKEKTPHFCAANPNLPLLNAGQPYVYDFVANNDVDPNYNDTPFTIELAKDYANPGWVRIEDNKLIVDEVPATIEQMEQVFITIKNIPGGRSKVFTLKLFINV